VFAGGIHISAQSPQFQEQRGEFEGTIGGEANNRYFPTRWFSETCKFPSEVRNSASSNCAVYSSIACDEIRVVYVLHDWWWWDALVDSPSRAE